MLLQGEGATLRPLAGQGLSICVSCIMGSGTPIAGNGVARGFTS